jgi:hypothetical protein
LAYVAAVYALRDRIDAAGIRVLTACSAMSAVTAAMIRLSKIAEPVRMAGCLVPATRHTAVAGTAASLFCSIGRTIEVLADGRLAPREGWRVKRSFLLPEPVGRRTGRLFESADAVTLPAVWPSLQSVEFYVDTNVRGLNVALDAAARSSSLRAIVGALQRPGVKLSRLLGREASGVGYEIEGSDGRIARLALVALQHGYLTAVAPSVLAARKLAADEFPHRGLVWPDRHIDPAELLEYLGQRGVQFVTGPD